MHLREHKSNDIKYIQEWKKVHSEKSSFDKSSVLNNKEIEEIVCCDKKNEIWYAICSDEDEYMGTIGLTNIRNNSAKLEMVVREKAYGKGYAWYGIEALIKQAFDTIEELETIYWNIDRQNGRAIRFCDKHNFHELEDFTKDIENTFDDIEQYKWYSVLRGDEFENRDIVAGCRIVRIKTIPTVDAGELSFFEARNEIDFDIKRIYYISKVPEGVRRGYHAHKKLKQLLFCPYGRIQLVLENEFGREEIELSDPSIGVVIDRPTWREMLWLQKDSVLCVVASELYDKDDYIRDYDEYKKMVNKLVISERTNGL